MEILEKSMATLEVKKLSRYFGGLAAVSDLDFQVTEGEILGLIGHNGAGKTTVFNLITGVFKPQRGQVFFRGREITHARTHAIARQGLVRTFQATNLFKEMTVWENLIVAHHLHFRRGFFGRILNLPSVQRDFRESRKRAEEIIAFLRLSELKDELAKNLPHGHQRALGIGIALAAEPKLLLLDEPVTGMNPEETEEMVERIREIRGRGITIVIIEHDMKAVMGLSDRIVAMGFGRKIAEGRPEEIQHNQVVIESYLGAEEEGEP